MTARRYPRVEVVWVDVKTFVGWHDPADPTPLPVVTQVGYILRRNKRELVLISSHIDDGDIGDPTVIPAGLVRSVTRI